MAFDNPYSVSPDEDRIQVPPADVPGWSENINFCCHAGDDSDCGVYSHMSRMHDDPEIWEGVLGVYLPDGELLVSRSFGRATSSDEASTGPLTFRPVKPLEQWSMRFDGMARRVHRSAPASGFVTDGPVELLQLELTLDAASPVWSMGPAIGKAGTDQTWASMHLEQAVRAHGTVRTRGRTIEVDNIVFRDHSAGVRHYEPLRGEAWAICAFPSGRIVAGLQVWQDGGSRVEHGFVYDGQRLHEISDVTLEILAGSDGTPHDFNLEFDGPYGRSKLSGRMRNSLALTLDEPIGMPLGTDLARGLIVTEGPARYRWDGEEGLGWIERTVRASDMR